MQSLQLTRPSLLLLGSGLVGGWVESSCHQATSKPKPLGVITKTESSAPRQQTTEQTDNSLPIAIATIFQSGQTPDAVFTELMPAVVDALQCELTSQR